MGFFDFLKSKRGLHLSQLAKRLGYDYLARDEYGVRHLLMDFQLLKIGGRKRIKHIISKDFYDPDLKIKIFDYQYTISTGQSSATYVQTVFFANCKELGLPKFCLKPENLLHTIGAWLGKNDIDFESFPEFSKSYHLTGEDEYIIRQTFSDDVLQYFTQHSGWSVEGLNYFLIFYKSKKRQAPEVMQPFIQQGFEILDLFMHKGYSV
ncbi:MAG: hypothetical protein HKN76_17430 [Saprospiraceae bacterium]|nr:hypothetical protein [Saprospiraceae bacterium]